MRFLAVFLFSSTLLAGDRVALLRFGFDVLNGPPAVADHLRDDSGPYRIIHLRRNMNGAIAKNLEAAGVRLVSYLPENCFVVYSEDITPLEQDPHIDWHGPFQPAYKIHPSLDDLPSRATGEFPLLITLHAGTDPDAAANAVEALGGRIIDRLETDPVIRLAAVFQDPTVVSVLAHLPDVRWLSEPLTRTPRNDRARWLVQSYAAPGPATQETPLYDHNLTGTGEVIGLIDTTPDLEHCLLRDPEDDPPGPNHRKFVYYDSASAAMDHGTHVSATLAGRHEDGSLGAAGIAYDAKIAYTQLPGTQSGNLYTIFATHAAAGAAIHSNSWGSSSKDYTVDCADLDNFAWQNEEALVLFACVNDSVFPLTTLDSPENALNALAIGAAESGDVMFPEVLAERHGSCATGPVPLDARRKPELFAPGESLLSALYQTDCGLDPAGGTSTATPVVAGSAALIRQYFREGFYPKGRQAGDAPRTPSGALLKSLLLLGSVNMTEENEPSPGAYLDNPIPNNVEGWGRINLDNSLYFSGDRRQLRISDVRNGDGLDTGASFSVVYRVLSDQEPLHVSLTFTQPPGSPGTLSPITNDLNLMVLAPDGQTYLGNVFSGGQSVVGGSSDPLNNVEMVRLPQPQPGTYTLTVTAEAVNLGPQGFALACSGDLIENSCEEIELDAGESTRLTCWGDSVLLGEGLPHGLAGSIQWAPASGLDDPLSRTPLATPEATTTYEVTATLPGGCIKTAQVTIEVPEMDGDSDGDLDALDFLLGLPYWASDNPSGDYNDDGRRNLLDLLLLNSCL